MLSTDVWIALGVGLGCGGGITAVTSYFRDRQAAIATSSQQAFDQAMAMIRENSIRMDALEKEHSECQRGRIEDQFKFGELSGRLLELRQLIGKEPGTGSLPTFEPALESTGDGKVDIVVVADPRHQ